MENKDFIPGDINEQNDNKQNSNVENIDTTINDNINNTEDMVSSNIYKGKIFKDIKEIDITKDTSDGVQANNYKYKDLKKMNKLLEELNELDPDDVLEEYSEKKLSAMYLASTTLDKIVYADDTLEGNNENTFVNSMILDGDESEDFTIRKVSVKPSSKDSKKLLMALSSGLGISTPVNIPLYHSGFWITLSNLSDLDIIAIESEIADRASELGFKTNGLVFANDDIILNNIIIEFVKDKIMATSLKIDDIENIGGYIKKPDIPIIILGLIRSLYQDSYTIIETCGNTVKDNIYCDYTFEAKVDPRKLLWVNRDKLSKEHIIHMSNRRPGSHTIEDVKKYQDSLYNNINNVYTYESNGNIIEYKLKVPTYEESVVNGEYWVNTIETSVENIVGDNDTEATRLAKVRMLSRLTVLMQYNSWIESISYNGVTIDDIYEITELLETLSGATDLVKDMLKNIKEYMRKSIVALVGTPAYICPKCKQDVDDKNSPEGFKEIVPFNVTATFLDLSTSMLKKMDSRDII